jgi:hypothetical protein
VVVWQVGKHLGDVQNALPLRSVCKEWRETATLSATEAHIDLSPDLFENGACGKAKKQLFYRRCPRLQKLTYHVSPAVSLVKVGCRDAAETARCMCRGNLGAGTAEQKTAASSSKTVRSACAL